MGALENSTVPPLPDGCTHHFFISKDEKFKNDAILVATWLAEMGFKVWESNVEQEHERGVTPDDMQQGVQHAAVIVLLLSPGVFHVRRHFVWNIELKYALETCRKPLLVLKLPEFSSDKCNSTFATTVEPHHVECCKGTSDDFQLWSRAILRVPTRVAWKLSGVDQKIKIMLEFRKIHDRGYVEDPAFRAEIDRQRVIHVEHGSCNGEGCLDEKVIARFESICHEQGTRDRLKVLSKDFTGRRWLADRVVELLDQEHSAAAGGESKTKFSHPFLVIYGDSGTGKSAFFSRMFDTSFCAKEGGAWSHLHGRMLAHHICRVQDDYSLKPFEWARRLACQIFLAFSKIGKRKQALEVSGYKDVDDFIQWIERETDVKKILDECVIELLNSVEDAAALGGMDTIGIDSLDEALTEAVLGGTSKFTIVTYLLRYRHKWPTWIRFLATSRPGMDDKTKKCLDPLTGDAKIDVKDEKNLDDVREFVKMKMKHFRDRTFGGQSPRLPSDGRDLVSESMDAASKSSLRVTSQSFRLSFEETTRLICEKADGVFMYAAEVLRHLESTPTLNLESLPKGLAELYMTRYMKTFPDDDALDQFEEHSGPMLSAANGGGAGSWC